MTLLRLNSLLFALTVLLTLVSCGKDKPAEPTPPPSIFTFDSQLPPEQRTALNQAVEAIDAFPLTDPDPALTELGKLPDASPASLRAWLSSRVRYVLPETADLKNRLWSVDRDYTYENPGQLPRVITANAEERGATVMSNPGALIYCLGKKENKLLAVDVEAVGMVYLTSPRTGLLQMGEGMLAIPTKNSFSDALTRKFHLSVLFHEARHSDGNRLSTGFFHAKCPRGDYAGIYACDENTNGPYSIEAAMLKSQIRSCKDCSYRETNVLRIIYLDTSDRVIPGSGPWDDSPEGQP